MNSKSIHGVEGTAMDIGQDRKCIAKASHVVGLTPTQAQSTILG
jgi:hypothetical protein